MNKFIVVVPTYNADKYIKRCLNSVLSQTYKNYDVCVIDDCSTDYTWRIVNEVQHHNNNPFILCKNEYRRASPLANIVKGIELTAFDKQDVVVILDGDDYLYDNDVFNHINMIYNDQNVWMTYGQFIPSDGSYPPFCKPIPDTRTYRKRREWFASHLKTFKKGLFSLIKDSDLRDKSGVYYPFVGDAALMYPMVEMCGKRHMRFVDKLTYVYNNQNSLNEMNVNMKEQLRLGVEIQDKPIYSEIISL